MRIRALPTLATTVFSLLSLTGVASAHMLAGGDDDIIPDQVSILSMTHGGSGCPVDSVGASFSPDYQYLTLIFDSYEAEVGPDVTYPKKRLFCHIVMQLGFPAGLSFALVDLTYTGWADLDSGIKASQTSTYYFQGFTKDERYTFKNPLIGPYYGEFWSTDTLAMLSWSPCDKKRGLNIVSSVQIDNKRNKSGHGSISIDSLETQVSEKYGVRWRRCT